MERSARTAAIRSRAKLARRSDETQEWLRLRANAAAPTSASSKTAGSQRTTTATRSPRPASMPGSRSRSAAILGPRPRCRALGPATHETDRPALHRRGARESRTRAFASIATDGWSKREPGAVRRPSFASRLGQHRFIHYKSYADWKASQAQFGKGTAFDALLGEVKGMSRAIAAMEILGPTPKATVRYVNDRIRGDETLFLPGKLRARGLSKKLGPFGDLWDEYTGALRQPEDRTLALAFSAYRASRPRRSSGARRSRRFRRRLRHGDPPFQRPARRRDRRRLRQDAERPALAARSSYLSFVPEVWTSHVSGHAPLPRRGADRRDLAARRRPACSAHRASWRSPTRGGRCMGSTFIYATMVRDKASPSSSPPGARRSSATGSARRSGTRSAAPRPRSCPTAWT
jgi:hypothetical protein